MRIAFAALALIAATLTLPAEAASRSTVRAVGNVPLHAGPGLRYSIIDRLPDGTRVHLERCTHESEWCLVLIEGEPAGWARGGALVGSGAKLQVTPYRFEFFDPLDPIPPRKHPK